MRLLYASHTYLVNENQKKLAAIAAHPKVESLHCVVPHLWKEPVLGEVYPYLPEAANYTVTPINIALAGNEMRFMYYSRDLLLKDLQPDLIVIENGPGAFSYTQFLRARNKFSPASKAVFFTWWNLPYQARQPLAALEQWNLRQSDGAIAGNQDAADILRDHHYHGPMLVLPQLGVDEVVFSPGDPAAVKAELKLQHFVIGYAGRLVPEKGIQTLMDALSAATFNFDLFILGAGPLLEDLKRWGAQLPAGQTLHIHPSVPHTEVARLMTAMDVFVLPSLSTSFWLEQFGHVLIEAMACEVPVIGSSSAEIPNVIGDAGIVFPEGDVAALTSALTTLATDPAQRKTIALAGRQRVLDRYTHAQIANQTVAFFETLIS